MLKMLMQSCFFGETSIGHAEDIHFPAGFLAKSRQAARQLFCRTDLYMLSHKGLDEVDHGLVIVLRRPEAALIQKFLECQLDNLSSRRPQFQGAKVCLQSRPDVCVKPGIDIPPCSFGWC